MHIYKKMPAAQHHAMPHEHVLQPIVLPQINDIKDWLTGRGWEADVFKLTQRRPAPRKDDWLALAREKAGLA